MYLELVAARGILGQNEGHFRGVFASDPELHFSKQVVVCGIYLVPARL